MSHSNLTCKLNNNISKRIFSILRGIADKLRSRAGQVGGSNPFTRAARGKGAIRSSKEREGCGFASDFLRGPVGVVARRRLSVVGFEDEEGRGEMSDMGCVLELEVMGINADSGPLASSTTRTRNGHAN